MKQTKGPVMNPPPTTTTTTRAPSIRKAHHDSVLG